MLFMKQTIRKVRQMRSKAFKALVRNAFRKNGSGGATASLPVGVALLLSGVIVFSLILGAWFSSFSWWWHRFDPEPAVICVNAPQKFKDYISEVNARDSAKEHKVFARFVWTKHEYVFDVAHFASVMDEYNSKLTIVFDADKDILTFYPAKDLDNFTWKENVRSYILNGYSDYITQNTGINESSDAITIREDPVEPPDSDKTDPVIKTLAFMLIPLVFFIIVLYTSMSKGTNIIAGAKEQNTFAAILMTPVSRTSIILGNITGVWMSSMIPVLFVSVPLLFVSSYRAGALPSVLMMAVLAFFVASVVILISVMSSNVISAQTAFLPVFLIFIALCITCMQNPEEYFGIYEYMPLYGQYLGIALALTEGVSILPVLVSSALTLLLAFLAVYVSVKLLGSERFTVSVMSASDRELIKARKEAGRAANKRLMLEARVSVYGYKPRSSMNHVSFSISQILRPLMLLSLFQLIALVPPLLMTDGEYLTQVMYSLKSVKNVSDVLSSGAKVIGVLMSTPAFLISMGVGYVLIDAYYCLRVRLFERTDLSSGLGFAKGHTIRIYITGIIAGTAMIASVFCILLAAGQIRITGFGIAPSSLPLFFSYVFMWLFQGACEEIMFRGYMIPRLAARYGLIPAITVSSLLFCLFHGMNPGFSVIAFINLVLISVLYALISYYTGNIWIVCAAHTFWNFTQGNIFGLEVSGNTGNVSVIHTGLGENASPLLTGGTFGPEGGLAVTAVTVIALVAVVLIFRKKKTSKQ